jgi:hypothetical protein
VRINLWCWIGRHEGKWSLPYPVTKTVRFVQSTSSGISESSPGTETVVYQDRWCLDCGVVQTRKTGATHFPIQRKRPVIVTLCGSGRFREAFEEAEFNETLAGSIVLTIGCNTKDVARTPDLERHKPMLDELHKCKIDLSDEILVLNVGGYVGSSTRSEIEYAAAHGKRIRWLEPAKG